MRVASVVKAASILVAATLSGVPKMAHAADASCTLFYVVQPGDTLNKIAQFSYGKWDYQLIFSRNVETLKNPAELPVGKMLLIPCANGIEPSFDLVVAEIAEAQQTATSTTAVEEEPAERPQEPSPESVVATAAPATDPGVDRLKLLTSSGLPPFSDKSLRGGGMATELANRSLEKLGIKDASRIVFIDDRSSHLQDLLIDGSFDLGFPWFRPACEQMGLLEEMSPDEAWLCKNFTFSEPFYEFVYGFFVPKGQHSLARTTFVDFSDSRICRPAGSSILDLAVNGLTEEDTTFVRPDTLAECFAMLEAGDVDAVSGEAFEAENLLAELDLFDQVEELPNLGLLQTIHAVAPIGKPGADDAIAAMNKGLIELKVSGEWFRIVGRHLTKN